MLARLVARSKSRPDVSPGRALFVAAFIGFWMLVVCARLVYLQFSQYESLANRARQQQQNAIETSPQRGELLDRQERQLARSVQTVSLFLDPDGLDAATLDRNAQQLAQVARSEASRSREGVSRSAGSEEDGSSGLRGVWTQIIANKIVELNLPGFANTTRAEALLPEWITRGARARLRRTRWQRSRRRRTVLQREDLGRARAAVSSKKTRTASRTRVTRSLRSPARQLC